MVKIVIKIGLSCASVIVCSVFHEKVWQGFSFGEGWISLAGLDFASVGGRLMATRMGLGQLVGGGSRLHTTRSGDLLAL